MAIPQRRVFTRAPLVDAGDYNGTVGNTGVYMGTLVYGLFPR